MARLIVGSRGGECNRLSQDASSLPASQAASMLKFAGSAGAALLPIQAKLPLRAAPISVIPSAVR